MEQINLYPGLTYTIPDVPKKSAIAGSDLPIKKQKWIRPVPPENHEFLSEDEQLAIAYEEDRRSTDGYWFMCKGAPTYINGDNYFYLTHFTIDEGYPQYRDVDRRWFYAWEICDKDPDCLGLIYDKKRRDGFSYRAMSIKLNRARKTFNSNYGMMSKTGADAQELFRKFIYGFRNLYSFLKPQVSTAEDVKKSLILGTPVKRVTHKTRKIQKEVSLNTKIDWKNTATNSYDSEKIKLLTADEAAKWEEANFEVWFNKAKTTAILGGKIIGKLLVGTTVNEASKGGDAFHNVWDSSLATKRDLNGRTTSGLYRYFVPAFDGMEGFIDEYGQGVIDTPAEPVMGIDGNMITIGSRPFKENTRKSLRDSKNLVAYYEELRQFPFKEEDSFIIPANEKMVFDLDRIYEQIEHNEMANIHLVRGNFDWKNGQRDTEVEWVPNDNGRWLMHWMPKPELRNVTKKIYGKIAPVNDHTGLFALDPYASVKTISPTRESKAASHGFRKLDLNEIETSDCFVTEYWGRPSDPLIVYEDMIKQCVFYGWKIYVERNVKGCFDYFRMRGYDNYLMKRTANTFSETSQDDEPGLPNYSQAVRTVLIENYQNYIVNRVGYNQSTGKIGLMPFTNTLKDNIDFDPDKWTDYDLTVSAMIVVVGSRGFIPPKRTYTDPIILFPKFDNSGMLSTLIE